MPDLRLALERVAVLLPAMPCFAGSPSGSALVDGCQLGGETAACWTTQLPVDFEGVALDI